MSIALNILVKPAAILMCAAMLSLLLSRSSASVRHAVWILAMAGAVLLPIAALLVPQFEWPVVPTASTSVTFLQDIGPSVGTVYDRPATDRVPPQKTPSAPLWLAGLWTAGFVLLLGRLLGSNLALRRLVRSGTPMESWDGLIEDLSTRLGNRRQVRLLFTDALVSPMTWGVLRHTILLPSAATGWSEERRRLVLAHELAHVRRHDGLIQVLGQIICSVYWFNPLVWYAAHRMRLERERACDDHVLSLGAAAADYAEHLVEIVRGLRPYRAVSFATVSMAQPSQLETRLRSILDGRARRRRLSKAGALLLCALTGIFTVSIASIGVTAAVPLPPVTIVSIRLAPLAPAPKPAAKPVAAPQRTRIGNADTTPNNAVVAPRVLESKPPIYTDEAIRARIEGTVTLEAAVDMEGGIRILRVVKGLGYGLDERAMGAILDWKFGPATRNGVPVEAITQVDVDFKLPPPRFDKDGSEISTVGPGVTPPTVISRVEPQYTPEARDVRYQGTVVVKATVHADGTLTVDQIVRDLDYGLGKKAVEALEQWKFKPGMRNGEAVPVSLNIEVNFNLK
jgi:TonB family protein